MKRFIVIATLFALALVGCLFALGTLPVRSAFLAVLAIQAVAFTVSERRAVLYIATLTSEQVKEFGEILEQMKTDFDQVKQFVREFPQLKDSVALLRRAGLSGGPTVVPPGSLVSDKCAETLVGLAIVSGQRKGKFDLLDTSKRETLMNMGKSFLGEAQFKTALTSSDIPLPVQYSGEVVALVNQYGAARRYGTVFPAGNGSLKLPQLKTDTAFGLISGSGTVTEKSPQTEWVTFNAEKFGGLIRLPSEMDEDSIISLGNFISDYAARNIAQVEDQVFWMNLDGSTYGAVKGLCGSTITNSKVVQLVSTKTAYSDATLSKLRELRNKPDASALRMGAYYMHPSFEQLLSSFNSSGDRPYNPNAQLANANSAQPFITGPTLDGFPVRWVDIMPAYSTSANASKVFMLFGDTRYQYLAPRGPIRFQTSVDAAFETDEVLMRALERFTIGLMATGAVAGLQTAAS